MSVNKYGLSGKDTEDDIKKVRLNINHTAFHLDCIEFIAHPHIYNNN